MTDGFGSTTLAVDFIKDVESRSLVITEFDEKLWLAVIDTATVAQDSTITFRFRNGSEVTT